jgi:hypothetical protein
VPADEHNGDVGVPRIFFQGIGQVDAADPRELDIRDDQVRVVQVQMRLPPDIIGDDEVLRIRKIVAVQEIDDPCPHKAGIFDNNDFIHAIASIPLALL